MAMQSFLFGGQTGKTPEQVAKQRELAQLMASQASRGPKNVGEGLTAVGQALAYRMNTDAANKGENEGRAAFAPMYDALFADDGTPPTDTEFAGIMGHDWASPGQRAVAQALQQRGWNQQDTAADRAWQERFRAAGWGREDARDATQWERGAPMRDLELQQAQLDYQQDLNPVPDPGFTMLAPDEVASAQLPAGSYQRGPDGKVYEIGGGGVEINMPGAPMIGTIPPSYAATQDPTTQAWSMAPIPGSPAAAELEADAARAGAGAESDAILTDTVTGAAQNIRGKIGALTTGVGGWMLGNLPFTDAGELYKNVSTLKSIATTENLQAMRDASKTGAALGAITAPELVLLQDKAGPMDPANPSFPQQLDDYERTLLRIIHGEAEGDKIFAQTRQGTTAPDQGTAPAVQRAPSVGTIIDGHRFKGGDPSVQANWEKVN
jgi:hypothetical protein